MRYDLVIRNGRVIDGSGLPATPADVGIVDGRIACVGRIRDAAEDVIDAEGHVVAPGFVDGHTHMDAQIFWDPLGTCSCWHGVTSVVMGNCGFTLAPARDAERELVVRNLERAEDIDADAMAQGIDWTWETFPEYLDALERLPKGINYSAQIGHSALRTFTMGERAFEEEANDDDLAAMERELRDALRAGALGFTTSRTRNHATSDDRPVASRLASWDEVCRLVGVMSDMNTGVFELANEDSPRGDPELRTEYFDRLLALAVESGRPMSWGIIASRHLSGVWRDWLALTDRAAERGGRIFAQVHAREFTVVLSFKTRLPFDELPEWREVRQLPLDAQRKAFEDPQTRARLVAAAHHGHYGDAIGAEARKPDFDWIRVVNRPTPPNPTVNEVAAERGIDPVELMIDLALETGFDQLFGQVIANEEPETVLELMKHPRSVVTFSDSGAHVSQIMDSSLATHVLGHHVREQQSIPLEHAVRMLTYEPATAWGFSDRGLVREGFAADLVVFDPTTIAPRIPEVHFDLPGGARRLVQRADGILATVVGGRVLLRNGEHTGALPGRLIRGRVAASA